MADREKSDYDWIELVVRAGKLVGLNPVRTRWKLRAWQDKMGRRKSGAAVRAAALTREHKTCPKCGGINGPEETKCLHCEAGLHSRPVELITRFLRHFDIGLTPESVLSSLFVIAYAVVVYRGPGSTVMAMSPVDLIWLGGNFPPKTMADGWWRLWTAVFLHGGLVHLIFNVYALIYVAPMVREIYGAYKSLFVFVVGGVGASLVSLLWTVYSGTGGGVSIGGSGAICAFIGLVLAWGHRDGTSLGIGLRNAMGRWVLYILVFGFLVGSVDTAGHVGGWIVGGLLAFAVPTNLTRGDTDFWRIAGALSALAAVAAVLGIAYLAFFTPALAVPGIG